MAARDPAVRRRVSRHEAAAGQSAGDLREVLLVMVVSDPHQRRHIEDAEGRVPAAALPAGVIESLEPMNGRRSMSSQDIDRSLEAGTLGQWPPIRLDPRPLRERFRRKSIEPDVPHTDLDSGEVQGHVAGRPLTGDNRNRRIGKALRRLNDPRGR